MKTLPSINANTVSASRLVESLCVYYFTRQSTMIHGAPGIGKSQIVKQVSNILEIGLEDVRLTLLDPVDLRGLPSIDDGVTTWNVPDFLARIDPESKGILFLDEFNAARPDVQAACYSLLLDRRLGDWTLPDGWQVVAAGNRAEDRAFVHTMSSANADRMFHFDLEVSNEDWLDHARANDFHMCVTTYIEFRPNALHDFDPTRRRNCTPRKWEKMSDLLKTFDDLSSRGGDVPAATQSALIFSALPEHVATDFFAYWRMFKAMPDLTAIETAPEAAPIPDNMSARYATVAGLAARLCAPHIMQDAPEARRLFAAHFAYTARLSAEFRRLYVTLVGTAEPNHPAKQTTDYILYENDAQARTHR